MVKREYLTRKEEIEIRKILEEKTGYSIKSTLILNQVFRRSSLAAETGRNSNEIFEFIGDKVLNLFVTKAISFKCGSLDLHDDYSFRINENRFTQITQALVNNETLAKITDEWGIAKYLLLSASDIKNNVANETKVKADLFEAVLGGITVESNWNDKILETAVTKSLKIDETIKKMIENDHKVRCVDIDNAITILKEMAERHECSMPKYDITGPGPLGHDKNGNPICGCICRVTNDKTGFVVRVVSNTKKNAKKGAAYLILCRLLKMQNKYGPNDWFPYWTYKNGKLTPDRE